MMHANNVEKIKEQEKIISQQLWPTHPGELTNVLEHSTEQVWLTVMSDVIAEEQTFLWWIINCWTVAGGSVQ